MRETTADDLARYKKAKAELSSLTTSQTLRLYDYITATGWLGSVKSRRPIERKGHPIPWVTYSALNFLTKHLPPRPRVFEFGSGHSTMWWSLRAEKLISVEHDRKWFDLMKGQLPEMVDYRFVELVEDGAYSRAALQSGAQFDVISVDGRDRVNCIKHSISTLSAHGVLILDNSDRLRYVPGIETLKASGFSRIEFIGNGAMNGKPWETSVFYRPNSNCLGL